MSVLKNLNLLVAFLLELCMLAGLGYYGFHSYSSKAMQFSIGLGLPLLAILLWSYFGAPKSANRLAQPYLLVFELGLFLITALLVYKTGRHNWAFIFGGVSIASQVMALVWKQ